MIASMYTWADAWLLLSILCSKKLDNTFEFSDVIMAGDIINHAIFAQSEIDEGLERLLSGDFILLENNSLKIAEKALSLYEKIKNRKYLLDQLEYIENYLDAKPYSKDYKISLACKEKFILKEQYENAVRMYSGRFRNK
jgi:hypothetical protein